MTTNVSHLPPATIFTAIIALSGYASTESFSSGAQRVSVLELYTSEGGPSCPPPDRWLAKLKASDALFETVIPVAFHVDYWNYLGRRGFFPPLHRNSPPTKPTEQAGELTVVGHGDSYAVRFESAIVQGLKVNLMYLGTDLSHEIRRGKKPGRQQPGSQSGAPPSHTGSRRLAEGANHQVAI
jgi:hypothetical protein